MSKHLQLSQEFLDDSQLFLELGRLRSSVDRAYYAIHYGAVVLLCHLGIRAPRSNRGLVSLFGLEVVNKGVIEPEFGEMLSSANRNRTRSSYSAEAEVSFDMAYTSVENARLFLEKVRSILNS